MSDLPENWLEFFTDDGDSTPYYYNTVTGITMWEHPSTLADSEIKDIIDNAETRLSSGNISHEESDPSFLQEVPSPVEDDCKNDYISSSIAQLQQILNQTANNLESNDTEELPENWMLFYTDDDEPRPYYYNILSGETIWDHPSSIQVENENKQQAEEKLHGEELKIEKLANLYTSIDISLTGALSVHNEKNKTASNATAPNPTPVTTAIAAQDATPSVAAASEAAANVKIAENSSSSSSTKNPFDEDEDEDEVAAHTTITTISAAEANKPNGSNDSVSAATIVVSDNNAVVAVAANVSGKSEPPPLPDATTIPTTTTKTALTETTVAAMATAETGRFEGASPVPIGGALPENWLEFFTDDGENTPYYYNEITGETIWEHPSTLVTTAPDTSATSTTVVNETIDGAGTNASNVNSGCSINSSGSINNSGNNNSGVKSGGYSVTTTIASQSYVPTDKSNNTSNSNNIKETVTSSKSNSSNPFGDDDDDQALTSAAVSVPTKSTTQSTSKSGASSSPYNPFASDDHDERNGSPHQTTYQTATVYDKNIGKSTTLVKPIVSSAVVVGAKNSNNNSKNNSGNSIGNGKVSSSSNPFGDDDYPTTSNNSKGNSNNSGNNGRPMSLLQKAKSSGIVPKQAPLTSNSNSNSNSNSGTTSPNNPFADDYVPSSNNNNNNNRSAGIVSNQSNSNSNNRGIPVAVAVHANQKPPAPLNRYHSGANSDSNLIPQPPTRSAAGSPLENSTKTNNRYHVGGNVPPPPASRNNNNTTTANRANQSNTSGTRPPPPVVSPLNARGNASAQMMLSANGNNLSAQELSQLSKEMKWLLKIGVKPFTAEAYLKGAHNNAEEALLKINQFLINAVQLDPYDTQLSTWASRISIRVKSWLPNMMENNKPDYHTAYIVTVNFTSMCSTKNIQPWQLTIRYSQFYALHQLISRHLKYTRVNSEFPQCTAGQWFWGITDELRNERMNKFDTWLREVLLNSVLMTNKAVLEAVNVFLEIDSHVNE